MCTGVDLQGMITETDILFALLQRMNTNQMHFNASFAARTEFGQPLSSRR